MHGDEGLATREDVVTHDGFPVGVCEDGKLTLNLGWCRLAGLSLRVEDDPALDHHRDGVALERLVEARGGSKAAVAGSSR